MLLPADRLLELLQIEFKNLPFSGGSEEVSSHRSAATTLQLLLARERGGAGAIHRQFEKLSAMLDTLLREVPVNASAARTSMQALKAESDRARNTQAMAELEEGWRRALGELERIAHSVRDAAAIDAATRTRISLLLATWEAEDLLGQSGQAHHADTGSDQLDRERLSTYLRTRFDDPSLQVTAFSPLAGGFGKQTYLFDTQGRDFSGAFVMRRDFQYPLVDNDCHRVRNEYGVIRALHARGFIAPDALWLETDHQHLPGGDFIVMRRSPGVCGGTVFQPKNKVSDNIVRTLAKTLANLHTMRPILELAAHTESINAERWRMSTERCVRSYIESWLELLAVTPHLSSPACVSLLIWLLEHVPEMNGTPSLVHGDVGFHNFLLDDGRLSALLDWEFTHLGDPAEDFAGIRNSAGTSLDWNLFTRVYEEAGGTAISAERVHFFQVWGMVRNAVCSVLAAQIFLDGRADDIKFVLTPHAYVPMFINAAKKLIETGMNGNHPTSR